MSCSANRQIPDCVWL